MVGIDGKAVFRTCSSSVVVRELQEIGSSARKSSQKVLGTNNTVAAAVVHGGEDWERERERRC